jgi:hypothetical protein
MTMAEFTLPIKEMAWKKFTGKQVAERIVEAQRFAEMD